MISKLLKLITISEIERNRMNQVIDGVGKDVETVTNKQGGKQSKTLYAMHLVDPVFLCHFYDDEILSNIASFMLFGHKDDLIEAVECFYSDDSKKNTRAYILLAIAKVLQEGADKYAPNNWRLIPQEQHINHALIHYLAYLSGDTQDDHLEHCMCRLMMAYATAKSKGFEYREYVGE